MKNLFLSFFIFLILIFTACESTSERLERRDAARRYREWLKHQQDSIHQVRMDTLRHINVSPVDLGPDVIINE